MRQCINCQTLALTRMLELRHLLSEMWGRDGACQILSYIPHQKKSTSSSIMPATTMVGHWLSIDVEGRNEPLTFLAK